MRAFKNAGIFTSPTKQMPMLSFFSAVASFSSRAFLRTSGFSIPPTGNSTRGNTAGGMAHKK